MSMVKAELRAKDIMTPEPVCVEPSATIRELARIFEENEISGAPVVDAQGKVVGVVSKSDLIRRVSEGTLDVPPAYLFEVLYEQGGSENEGMVIPEPLVCVQDFMTEDPIVVSPDEPLRGVAKRMHAAHVHRVVVVDRDGFPVGMVTSMDMVGALAR